MRLENKVCIVTGSSSGIGKAIAESYAREGATVVVTYNNNKDGAVETAKNCNTDLVYHLDVRDSQQIVDVFADVAQKTGGVDVLVNNAGVNKTNDFDKLSEEDWDFVLDVNLKGVFLCCQKILPHMNEGGSIINIGSLSGEYGGPRTPSYAAAKAGVMSLTHCLARFVGDRKIRVNCLSPGVIGNEFTAKSMAPDVRKLVDNLLLLKHLGTVEDMTGAAVFLASDESSYMTAQTMSINGGAWV